MSSTDTITDPGPEGSDFDGSDGVSSNVKDSQISVFKVFSATKARDREVLGEKIAAWLATNPHLEIRETFVRLSSDREFHCLSFVLLCSDGRPPA